MGAWALRMIRRQKVTLMGVSTILVAADYRHDKDDKCRRA